MSKRSRPRARRSRRQSNHGPVTPSLLRNLGFDIIYIRPGGRICAERGRWVVYLLEGMDRTRLNQIMRRMGD